VLRSVPVLQSVQVPQPVPALRPVQRQWNVEEGLRG
jgi:hypothetical protein